MPGRRQDEPIGQIRQKIRKRIELAAATQVISNLEKLAAAKVPISDIDKIATKIIDDPKFLTQFVKNYKSAVKTLGITTPVK